MSRVMDRGETLELRAYDRSTSWRPAVVAFGVLLALLLGLYWATGLSLVATWARTGMFRYAFLIFPISAWLVWRKRHELVALYNPRPCMWALPLLAGTMFVWLLGWMVNVDLARHIAFIAAFPLLVLLVFGTSVFRALLFPMIYLIFAIPAGHSAVQPLQHITAIMSVHLLQWTGVPVLLQGGHYILTPSTSWEVAEACSGIKFFTACTAIGSLFAYLFFNSYWRRAGFILASAIVPIIANGLRVYFTILIGESFGLKYAQGTDHLVFGWQFFGTVLFLLLLVGWFLREPLPEEAGSPDVKRARRKPGRGLLFAAGAGAALLVIAPVWASVARAPIHSGTHRVVLASAGRWTRQGDLLGAVWLPSYAGANRVVAGRYAGPGSKQVSMFAASYLGPQVEGHDLLAYWHKNYDKDRWRATNARHRTVGLPGGAQWAVQEIVLRRGVSRRLLWYWYDINGRRETAPVWVRGWQALDGLRGDGPRSSIVLVSTAFGRGGKRRAVENLQHFVRAATSRLKHKLTGGGNSK